ncbi:rhodanese-like domain-containing protein [Listeria rocourtiae]|uniref:rhodanese-like domain-containing protein n=1 Tax=Listeria rocourtiae TaxID=647910 RepID=UPI003D2F6B0D
MFCLFKKIPTISIQELQGKLDKNTILLDVRSPLEYKRGHIKNAKNVPLNRISHYEQKKETTIFVICQSGVRSKQAFRKLTKKGYTVINVGGGMNHWHGPIKGGN